MTFPTQQPALLLDFCNSKQLDPRISFSRNSAATYFDSSGLIKEAPANTARFDHDPVTGESLGLLIEEERTNLFTYSEQFDQSTWTKEKVSLTPNAAIAPDGTTTAEEVLATGSGRHRISKQVIGSAGYVFSAFVKSNGTSHISIKCSGLDVATEFDIVNGTIARSAPNGGLTNPFVIPLANEWYRIGGTVSVSNNWLIGSSDGTSAYGATADINYTAQPGDAYYLWAAQLEEGSFPTSYIPTTGSTVTRAVDIALIDGVSFSSWYNQNEGTVFTDVSSAGAAGIVGFNDGSSSERFRIGFAASNNAAVVVVDGGVIQVNANTPGNSTPYNQFHKLCNAISENNLSFSYDGTLLTDSNLSVPSVNKMTIGSSIGISDRLNGHISRLSYYDSLLSNSELQTLTV